MNHYEPVSGYNPHVYNPLPGYNPLSPDIQPPPYQELWNLPSPVLPSPPPNNEGVPFAAPVQPVDGSAGYPSIPPASPPPQRALLDEFLLLKQITPWTYVSKPNCTCLQTSIITKIIGQINREKIKNELNELTPQITQAEDSLSFMPGTPQYQTKYRSLYGRWRIISWIARTPQEQREINQFTTKKNNLLTQIQKKEEETSLSSGQNFIQKNLPALEKATQTFYEFIGYQTPSQRKFVTDTQNFITTTSNKISTLGTQLQEANQIIQRAKTTTTDQLNQLTLNPSSNNEFTTFHSNKLRNIQNELSRQEVSPLNNASTLAPLDANTKVTDKQWKQSLSVMQGFIQCVLSDTLDSITFDDYKKAISFLQSFESNQSNEYKSEPIYRNTKQVFNELKNHIDNYMIQRKVSTLTQALLCENSSYSWEQDKARFDSLKSLEKENEGRSSFEPETTSTTYFQNSAVNHNQQIATKMQTAVNRLLTIGSNKSPDILEKANQILMATPFDPNKLLVIEQYKSLATSIQKQELADQPARPLPQAAQQRPAEQTQGILQKIVGFFRG